MIKTVQINQPDKQESDLLLFYISNYSSELVSNVQTSEKYDSWILARILLPFLKIKFL